MRVELTVLGLLTEENLYSYEIHKKIMEQVEGFADIKFGSIYHVMDKALKNGWVKQTGTEKDPGNPERYIYQILPEGKKHYKKLMKKYFDKSRLHFDIDIVLMFYNSLSDEQKEHFIEDRTSLVNDKLLMIKNKIKKSSNISFKNKNTQIYFYKYLENHLEAEQAWLKSLKEQT